MTLQRIIKVARGTGEADLVIKNAKIVNVLSEEIHEGDVAIADGIIAGIGKDYCGKEEIDASGKYVCPSFIDGHVHLESSMILPSEFAKTVLPTGTTTVIADPHEISNVFGLHGISFMYEAVKNLPLDVFIMLPSCVPATSYETSGFDLNGYDLSMLIDKPWVLGIAEMMNYAGVLNLDKTVMGKLELAHKYGKRIDGHAPFLSGKDLCAYVASGVKSDHECTVPEEAIEKLRLGMYIMVREGTAAKDLNALIPVLKNQNTRKIMFVTDDRHPSDLKEHINGIVRRCVEAGISPIKAIQCASLNTAEYFGLKDTGAIAPSCKADLLILPDLKTFTPDMVLKNGKIVAKDGQITEKFTEEEMPPLRGSVNVKWIEKDDFEIEAKSNVVKAIEIVPHQLITKAVKSEIKVENGKALPNTDNDTLKICVIERHRATGNIAKGFVKGFHLKSGAIGSTVAHDSHNMVIVGTNDYDMYVAAVKLVKLQGGKVVVKDGKVISELPLPIAGLISNLSYEETLKRTVELNEAVKSLGGTLDDAFMTMGFLSLPVIPELKITDKGVFDTNKFEFIDIFDV